MSSDFFGEPSVEKGEGPWCQVEGVSEQKLFSCAHFFLTRFLQHDKS